MDSLSRLAKEVSELLETKDLARERSLKLSRMVIRNCSAAIRAVHRKEFEDADRLMNVAGEALVEIDELLDLHQDVRHAGFVDDAEREFAEAKIVFSIINAQRIPGPESIGVDMVNFLAGLGDVTGELRRHILDLIRQGRANDGEFYLQVMEEIFHLLMLFDYPDAITRGLRRKSDLARSMLERTRGDLTNAKGRQDLEIGLQKFEDKLKEAGFKL
jgi:translin